jgi:hypothetical protein
MKPITIRIGQHTYHPTPVGRDGLYAWERKKRKQLKPIK